MDDSNGDEVVEQKSWTCFHFSTSKRGADVPEFLRLIATKLEELKNPEVLDITFARYWTREYGALEQETTISVYYYYD